MNVTDSKDWTYEQLVAASTALKAHNENCVGHPIQSPDAAKIVFGRIMDGTLQACYIEGFLLVYDVGPTWSTVEPLLYELLVIHALPTGSFSDYVQGLRDLAKQHACYGIMTGNGVLRPGLRRRYERVGFTKFNESYFLEV